MFLVVLLPGLAVLIVTWLLVRGYMLLRADPVEGLEVADLKLLQAEERRRSQGQGPLSRVADRFTPKVLNAMPFTWRQWLQRQVDLAGRPQGMTPSSVVKQGVIWAIIVLPAVVMMLLQGVYIMVLLLASLPVIMPLARLDRVNRKRRDRITQDLPDFLDVLAVTVSSGLAFRAALAKVAAQFDGPLGEEVMLTLHQIANGATLRTAFLRLRERNASEALSEFVTAYLQSEEFGAPLVEAIHQIAGDQRRSAAQRLRRKAAQVAPRVTLINSIVLAPGAMVLIIAALYLGTGIDFSQILGGK